MTIKELNSDIEQLRLSLGQLSPQDAKRSKILRQLRQLIDPPLEAEQQSPSKDNRLNHQVQILIEQTKKLETDNLSKIQRTLCQRELLSQAIALIEKSKKLWQNYEEQYADAYREAWLKMLEYFYRHYADYDPNKAQVTTWLNFRLKNEFHTQRAKLYQQSQRQAQPTEADQDNDDLLAMMESPSYGNAAKLMNEGIANWIENDVELQEITIKNQPEITAKFLLKERFVKETEWGKIAKKSGLSVATLSSFYERKCRTRLIEFVEIHYDFIPPDTPINPCEHIRELINQKELKKINFQEKIKSWVQSETLLALLTLRGHPDITGQIFLEKILVIIQQPRQGLIQVAESLQVEPGKLERFYEFHLIHPVLNFVHKTLMSNR